MAVNSPACIGRNPPHAAVGTPNVEAVSTPTRPVLPLDAVAEVLRRSGVHIVGELHADRISGGRSNLTFVLADDIHRWVIRRPPTGGLTPSAHDMTREWTVTSALQDTAVPVAASVAADLDGTAFGVPFTVMGFVDGTVIRTAADLADLTDEQVADNSDALVDTLAALHSVDIDAVGLRDFGRPDGFAARQVRTWTRQWEHVRTRDLPDLDRLAGALAERVPQSARHAVVHGDFRVDNTILAAGDPSTVAAVVDWEMATLGDPLTDVALMCVYRTPEFDRVLGFDAAWTSPRYPSADEMAQRYTRSSSVELDHWGFYLGLAYLKIAVIAEGITHRAISGADAGDGADRAAEATEALVTLGLRTLDQR